MNLKTTFVLLLLVLVVGGYFVFFERDRKTTEEIKNANANARIGDGTPLFKEADFSTTAVDTVTIEHGGKKIVLTKEDADWVQTEPVRFPLDQWSAQGIINAAAGLQYSRKLEPGKNNAPALEKLDLAPPVAVVTMHIGGDKPTTKTLKLGRQILGGLGYVMLDGDSSAYVVNDALHLAAIEQKPDSWRRKTIAAPTEGQAKSITLRRKGETIQLDKHEGNWSLGAPFSGRVDQQAVGGLLASMTAMSIEKFIDDTPSDTAIYGFNKPTVSLAITLPPPPPTPAATQAATQPAAEAKPIVKTFLIGSPVDMDQTAYFATWSESDKPSSVVFSVPKSALDAFNKPVDSFRDARLTPIKSADTSDVVIKKENQIVHVVRTPKGWTFGEPTPPFAADHGAVSDMLDQVIDARALKFEQLKGAAPAATHTIIITATGRTEPDVLHVTEVPNADPAKAEWRVMRNNETVVYELPHKALTGVFEPALALRDRQVLDLSADRIARVTLKQEDGTELAFERTIPPAPANTQAATQPAAGPGPWKLKGSEKFEAEALGGTVSDLAKLEAEKWLAAGAAPSTAQGATVVTLETADGEKKVVTVDPKTRTATVSGVDASFEINPAVYHAINQEFRERTVLPIAATEFKQVTIAHGNGKSLTVSKDTSGRYAADAAAGTVNQSIAGSLFDALGNLRVEHYLEPRKALEPNPENFTLTVETLDGRKIVLESEAARRAEGVIRMTGALGERWFSVSKEIMSKLDADLTAKESPKPPPMQGMQNFPGIQMPGGMGD